MSLLWLYLHQLELLGLTRQRHCLSNLYEQEEQRFAISLREVNSVDNAYWIKTVIRERALINSLNMHAPPVKSIYLGKKLTMRRFSPFEHELQAPDDYDVAEVQFRERGIQFLFQPTYAASDVSPNVADLFIRNFMPSNLAVTGRNMERHGRGAPTFRRWQFDLFEMRLAIRGGIDAQALHFG
jgi:hypothetical protein